MDPSLIARVVAQLQEPEGLSPRIGAFAPMCEEAREALQKEGFVCDQLIFGTGILAGDRPARFAQWLVRDQATGSTMTASATALFPTSDTWRIRLCAGELTTQEVYRRGPLVSAALDGALEIDIKADLKTATKDVVSKVRPSSNVGAQFSFNEAGNCVPRNKLVDMPTFLQNFARLLREALSV